MLFFNCYFVIVVYNIDMLMAFISWWYGKGWQWKADKILGGIERSMDTFSLGLLIKTWFAPFRQIDAAGGINSSLDVRIRRFFDRLVSRFIGALLRSAVMIIGIFYITLKALFGLILLAIWPFVPILPIIFIVLFLLNVKIGVFPKIKNSLNDYNSQKQISQPVKKKGLFR